MPLAVRPAASGPSRLPLLLWYWGPLALYAGAIFALSSMSRPPAPSLPFLHGDKVLHAMEYAGLGGLLYRALALGGRGIAARAALAAAAGLGALYGASDELHQAFVPMRTADVMDWAADVAGASAGAFIYQSLQKCLRSARGRRGRPSLHRGCRPEPQQPADFFNDRYHRMGLAGARRRGARAAS